MNDGPKMECHSKIMTDFKLYDRVRICANNKEAFIVWYDETPGHDSFLLELADEDEMPEFYKRKDFVVIGE